MTVATFDKGDSFLEMTGVGQGESALIERIRRFAAALPHADVDEYRRNIQARACRALLGQAAPDEPEFHLRPHIVAELNRITDAELGRYLFYRYRYDVFPKTLELDAYPPCVQIEPTSICNYRCVFCFQTDTSFTHKKHGHMGQMSIETFREIVDQLQGNVEAVTLASRGEPLLCKNIDQMLEYIGGKFLGLKMNTNAWHLTEARAHAILQAEPNTLVFSADAADADLYASLRVNGKLERVMENVRRFAEIKARYYPNSRTITRVSGVRYSDKQDFASIESFWGDYVDQVAFVNYHPWESAYESEPNGITKPCSDLYRRTFVWWDGRVNPCDVDFRSSLSVGTIKDAPLSALWSGEGYSALRGHHLAATRHLVSPCRSCGVI